MSSGALAVVGMARLPARLDCVGLKGWRLCVCVAPCCRQAAGPHTHTPYSHATSLKIARLQYARAAHGVRKWVIRVGDMYIYVFFSNSPFSVLVRSHSLSLARSPSHAHAHTHARTFVHISHFLSLIRWTWERRTICIRPDEKSPWVYRNNTVNHRG